MNPYDEWPPPPGLPPPAVSDRWQKELVRIAGLTPTGLPHLRLEWGGTCTWTPATKDLKYLHRTQDRQIGWLLDIKDSQGRVVRRRKFPMRISDTVMDRARAEVGLGEYAGLPYPEMLLNEQIGIPRFWISQFVPPSLVGPWDEVRHRVRDNAGVGSGSDPGAFPREGMYYLGFHPIWDHDNARKCCALARERRGTCFGYYRPPSEVDTMYCAVLWRENLQDYRHDWRDAPTPEEMRKNLMRLVDKHQEVEKKQREESKLRIRDVFKTHEGRFRSRKGVNRFIIHRPDTQA